MLHIIDFRADQHPIRLGRIHSGVDVPGLQAGRGALALELIVEPLPFLSESLEVAQDLFGLLLVPLRVGGARIGFVGRAQRHGEKQ